MESAPDADDTVPQEGPEVNDDSAPVNAGAGAAHVGAAADSASTEVARRRKPIRGEDVLGPLMKALGLPLH